MPTPAEEKYADIIKLPHHRSHTRPHMTNRDRAAQFSPFAALTGYEDAVAETARLTDQRLELTEEKKRLLDETLHLLLDMAEQPPIVRITYFLPDGKKAGGAYETVTGKVASADTFGGYVLLTDKRHIPINDIADIELA